MRLILVVLTCVAAVAFSGCGKKKQAPAPQLPKVTAAKPIKKDVTRHAYFTGHLDSFAKVDITARVEGFLRKRNFNDGDIVKKGTLLFEIEEDQYLANVEQAQGQLKSVIAQHNDADVNYKRIQYAFKQNVATSQELSDALAKFEVTKAEVETKDGILKQAQINLGYTKVYSPIDGMAGRHLIDVGNLVGYGQPTLLVTVVQQDPLYVYFEVSEQNVIKYRKFLREAKLRKRAHTCQGEQADLGEQVAGDDGKLPDVELDCVDINVRLAGESGYKHEGKLDLTFEGNVVNSSTGTITWRGILANKDLLMTPGMFARVQLPLLKVKDALLVPQVAISKDMGGTYVMVVSKDNIVKRRNVETVGENYENMVAIISGLKADDIVIIDGLQNVRPDVPCQPEIVQLKMQEAPKGIFIPGRFNDNPETPSSQPTVPASDSAMPTSAPAKPTEKTDDTTPKKKG